MRGRYIIPLAVLLAVLTLPIMADTGDSLPDQIELATSSTDEIGGSGSVSEPSSSAEESTSTPESSDPAIADSSSVPPDGAGETSTSMPDESSSVPDDLPLESEASSGASEPEQEPTEEPPVEESQYSVDDIALTLIFLLFAVSMGAGALLGHILMLGV